MDRLANFIYTRSRLIIAFVVIVNLASLASLFRISIDTDITGFFSEDNAVYAEYEALTEKYNISDSIVILVQSDDSLLSEKNLLSMVELRNQVEELPGVEQVQGFVPKEAVLGGHRFDVDERLIRFYYDDLEDYVRGSYIPARELLSDDETTGVLAMTLSYDADADALVQMLKPVVAAHSDLKLSLAGDAVIGDTLRWYLMRILFILPPAAASLVIFVFYLMLRNRRFAVLSIIPAGLGALWTLGTIFAQGKSVNVVTAVSPIFIVVMGSAYGLHYITHYLEKMQQYHDRRQLVVETMKMVAKPIVLTALTTIAGFVSLMWSDLTPFRQMGLYVPVGIAYAAFLSLVFLPAVLSHMELPLSVHAPQAEVVGVILGLARHKKAILAAVAVVLGLSALSIPSLRVISDPLLFFKQDSPIRQTFQTVEVTFGGALVLIGEIPAERGIETLRDHRYAEDVLSMERDLERVPGILSAQSLFDVVQGAYTAQGGGVDYPESPAVVNLILKNLDTEDTSSWYSDDGLRLVARTTDLTAQDVAALRDFQAHHAELRVISGTPVLYDELNKLTVNSQVKSLGLALFLVFIMLVLFLRQLRASVIALIPIGITIVAIMGVLAFTGYNLNLVTATLSSVAVGVGVDYSIHLLSGIQYFAGQGMSKEDAVRASVSTVSRPILANAFGLATGISVLFFSPLQVHTEVATVMWVAMIVSSLGALALIPLFYSSRTNSRESELERG